MKRALVLVLLLTSGGVLFAQTVQEIPCQVVAGGGGHAASLSHRAFSTFGQPVVGMSASPGQELRHGFVPCSYTATDVPPAEMPARSFILHQNTPNPFNPRTVIAYEVPARGGYIRLGIYDLAGRHVRDLVNQQESPGRKTVTWTGTDDSGRAVASGVYLYTLETPAGSFTKKMTLVR